MSPVIDVAPLLHPYRGRDTNRDTDRDGIVPSNGEGAPTTDQRIASLDVFRGLTVAVLLSNIPHVYLISESFTVMQFNSTSFAIYCIQ